MNYLTAIFSFVFSLSDSEGFSCLSILHLKKENNFYDFFLLKWCFKYDGSYKSLMSLNEAWAFSIDFVSESNEDKWNHFNQWKLISHANMFIQISISNWRTKVCDNEIISIIIIFPIYSRQSVKNNNFFVLLFFVLVNVFTLKLISKM